MVVLFEGCDGVGKTTQLNLISSSKEINTDFIKFNMDKPKGSSNREKFHREIKSLKSLTNLIISADKSNQSLLIDRGYLSFIVYGCLYREYDKTEAVSVVANEINKLNKHGIFPTFVVFTDSIQEIEKRDDGASLFSFEFNLKEAILRVQDEYKEALNQLDQHAIDYESISMNISNYRKESLDESILEIHQTLIRML